MAYLPPAGLRCLTDDKISHLATMCELPNPNYTEKMRKKVWQKKRLFTEADLPPISIKDEDWPPPKSHVYPKFPLYEEGCSARCQCVRPLPRFDSNAAHIGKNLGAKDPRELPYGLPPMTYDCKRRSNAYGTLSFREEKLCQVP
ncbi:hypothetical protein PoB_005802100 [Plakobranchus ocellatus]|uniref:Uncharacterized protein n=1 Tax=Plakobranchus ocellatus TaxID=259542 RepID=A0AAV4CJ59_9GAST|nr:hypothetical protein PoB_005802100 [Plakobranchus ocellatus]